MLDLDDGAPWDLVCSLMQAAPRKRLSASAAAAHPALGGGITAALNSLSRRAGDAADKVRAHCACQPCCQAFPPSLAKVLGAATALACQSSRRLQVHKYQATGHRISCTLRHVMQSWPLLK